MKRTTWLALAMAVPAAVQAQATITGVVRDTARHPLANAEVIVLSPLRSVRSDSAGRFVIDGLPAGTYDMRARRLGFFFAETKVVLAERATKVLVFELYDRPQILASVDVTAKCPRWEMGGFVCRQAKGGRGFFMDEEAIDAKHALEIGELFADVPGMRPAGRGYVSNVGWKCTTYIANGKPIDSSRGNPKPNWPSDLIGIEIYLNPDSVPGEYSHFVWKNLGRQKTPTRCGVINYWTSGRPRYTPGTRKK